MAPQQPDNSGACFRNLQLKLRFEFPEGYRFAEQEALVHLTAARTQEVQLLQRLHALGDRLQMEVARQRSLLYLLRNVLSASAPAHNWKKSY